MSAKTKIFTLNGHDYRLRKLGVDEGTYIFNRMMGSLMDAAPADRSQADEPEDPTKRLTDEQRTRLVCSLAIMRGLKYEDMKFVRRNALQAIDRVEPLPTGDANTPVYESGKFIPPPPDWPDLEEDAATRQQLELEALVFSLTSFFSGAGVKK